MREIQCSVRPFYTGLGVILVITAVWGIESGSSDRVGADAARMIGDESLEAPQESSPVAGISEQLSATVGAPGEMSPEIPQNVDIQNDGLITYDRDEGTLTYVGEPTVYMASDNHIEVYARKAILDTKNKTVTLIGDVSIFRDGSLSRADKAIYYYDREEMQTEGINAKSNGMILRSGQFKYAKNEKGEDYLEGFEASVTSEDDQDPDSWISANRIRIYPQDRLDFSHLTFNYKNIPFFYFPYFSHSLNPREGYTPAIGSRSYWGAYLANRYGVLVGNRRVEHERPTADYLFQSNLDYRTRRGFALGEDIIDLRLEEEAPDMKGFSIYYAYDENPTISPTDEVRNNIDHDRWRIALQHMWELPINDSSHVDWRLKANLNVLSDEYVLRDFYQDLFEVNSEPDNTVTLERTDDVSVLTLLQRMPINDFYITDQRSEISYDRVRGPLWDSRFVYESQTSLSMMRQVVPAEMRGSIRDRLDHMALGDPDREFWEYMLKTDSFLRFHTYHELSASFQAWDFLNLTPRIGGGYTGYFDPSGDLASFNQGIFYSGIDASFKISKKYRSARWEALGVNTLNHIIQPYASLMYMGVNELDSPYPRIEGSASTTNPMALSVGRMSEIDALSTCSVVRYGLRNFLMTEQDGVNRQWFSWDAFMDAYLHNASTNQEFSNLYSMIRWSPLPWFSYASVMQFPVIGDEKRDNYQEYNNSLWFQPFRPLEILIGHRYLTKHPILPNSNQLNLRVIYRISEELALGGSWRWELERMSNKLEIQEYNIYKNMGSWYLGLGVYMRVNGNKNELGFGMSFTLKETGNYMPISFN